MAKLLCDYCEKEAKYIWWTEEENMHNGNSGPRPVLYPLCEDHGSDMFPRIKVKIENGGESKCQR